MDAVCRHMMDGTCDVSRVEYASREFLYEAELDDCILIMLDWDGDWEAHIIDSSAFEHATALWCKVDHSLVFIRKRLSDGQ